jgi:hypothetical protein
MAIVKQLSDGNPDGVVLGQSASDLIAFHGSAPCDQAAVVTAVSTSVLTTGLLGFNTTAQANALIAAVNSILVALKEKGLMAS